MLSKIHFSRYFSSRAQPILPLDPGKDIGRLGLNLSNSYLKHSYERRISLKAIIIISLPLGWIESDINALVLTTHSIKSLCLLPDTMNVKPEGVTLLQYYVSY